MASSGHDFELTSKGNVEANICDEVTLPCHLSPDISAVAMSIRWFKETECVYLYKNGQVIEGRGYEDRLSLVTQELERGNVSLTLRDYRESDRGVYICQVIHGEQEQEKAVGLWSRNVMRMRRAPLWPSRYLEKESPEMKQQRIRSADRLAQNICDLKTEAERLKNELSFKSTERAEVSDTGLTLPIRRRHRMEKPPTMGAESPDPESTLPLRRRWSFELMPPTMGAESSAPDSPVSPSVSELRLVLEETRVRETRVQRSQLGVLDSLRRNSV